MQEADLTDRRLALYSAGAGEPSEEGLAESKARERDFGTRSAIRGDGACR